MLIEIKGVQFENKGAELMLYSIVEQIHFRWPTAEICLRPRLKSPYVKRASIGAYQKLHLAKSSIDLNKLTYWLPKKVKHYLKRVWGIVTEADIDVVLDASGFSYGDQWGPHCLDAIEKEVVRLKRYNKHYVFLPQALGPFNRNELQTKARNIFTNARLIFAREQQSFEHVEKLSKGNVFIAPDFTNLYSPEADASFTNLQGQVAIIVNSKMVSNKNTNSYWREHYVNNIAQIMTALIEQGHTVFLLNHEGEQDQSLCESLQAKIGDVDIISPDNANDVKGIIKQCSFVVSSRFHGCVSALSSGVPCIATSWSHKYEQLYMEYQVSDYLLNKQHFEEPIAEFLAQFVLKLPKIRLQLQEQSQVYSAQSNEMWQKVEEQLSY